MIALAPQQIEARDSVFGMLRSGASEVKLGGFAGTGKTLLVSHIAKQMQEVAVLAPTGKACSVLGAKDIWAQTCHRYIYGHPLKVLCPHCKGPGCKKCKWKGHKEDFKWVMKADGPDTGLPLLLIVDEASMISNRLADDLRSLGAPILWVGDPAQLPPVRDDAKLMHEPDILLTDIHRQDAGSYVLDLATRVRNGEIPSGRGVYRGKPPDEVLFRADMVLCGHNQTRHAVNRRIRAMKGLPKHLTAGDQLLVLRNEGSLANGDIIEVVEVQRDQGSTMSVVVRHPGGWNYSTDIWTGAMGGEPDFTAMRPGPLIVDYGYCLTIHKSQGSEWDKVAIIEQDIPGVEIARLRYTGITRCREKLGYYR